MGLLSFLGFEPVPGTSEWESKQVRVIKRANLASCVKILKELGDSPKLVSCAVERIKTLAVSFDDYELVLSKVPFHQGLTELMVGKMLASAYDKDQLWRFLDVCPEGLPIRLKAIERLCDTTNTFVSWLRLAEEVRCYDPGLPLNQRIQQGLRRTAQTEANWWTIASQSRDPVEKQKIIDGRLNGANNLSALVDLFWAVPCELEDEILGRIRSLDLPRSEWRETYNDEDADHSARIDAILFAKALEKSCSVAEVLDLYDLAEEQDEEALKEKATIRLVEIQPSKSELEKIKDDYDLSGDKLGEVVFRLLTDLAGDTPKRIKLYLDYVEDAEGEGDEIAQSIRDVLVAKVTLSECYLIAALTDLDDLRLAVEKRSDELVGLES